MVGRKDQNDKIFFKLLLLAVYFVFFAVQLILRYTSIQSQQTFGPNIYLSVSVGKPGIANSILFREDHKKNISLLYLNKRYHPKGAVLIPPQNFQIHCFYSEVPEKCYFRPDNITEIKINSPFLRGPPSAI
jgi:hypothetical protein